MIFPDSIAHLVSFAIDLVHEERISYYPQLLPFRLGSYTLYTTNRWKPADPLQLFLQKDQSQLLGDRLSFKVYILQVDPRIHHCSPVFWSILIDGVDALHIWIKIHIRGIGVDYFSGVSVVSACS